MGRPFFTIAIFALTALSMTVNGQYSWTKKADFPGNTRYYDAGFSIGHYGFIGCGENSSSYFTDFYKWNQNSNQWTSIASYPGTGSITPISASIEGKGYIGLGEATGYIVQNDLWRYDTTSASWNAMSSLPGSGRYDASFFTIGHKIYVVGGSTGGPPYLNDVWVYDAHKNTWTQLNNSPAGKVDNMVAFAIDNHGYIGGGWDGSSAQSACWEYDTTNDSWTSIASLPIAIWGDPRAFAIGSKAYVCTGLDGSGNALSNGYVYDTITKDWSIFTDMNANGIERGHAVAFSIGGIGYIGTGHDNSGNYLNDFWQYGIDTSSCNSWIQKSNFSGAARYYDAGFSIGHYGFIGCGENSSSYFTDFYKWNQNSNQWTSIASYPGTGSITPISASIEGKGYIGLGEATGYIVQNDLWRYDTTSASWNAMASLPGSGRYDASFFTIGHKIYVVGGSTGGPPYLNDAWVYDAHKNTWTQLNNSPAGKVDNMVAFAINNHGYIGGGWDGSSAQNACWEYDTTNDSWTSVASLPIAVWGDPRAFVVGSKAYVCTGLDAGGNALSNGYVYDTITKDWSIFTDMNANGIERGHAVAFSIGDIGYIGTGHDNSGNYLNDFWQYHLCSESGIYQLSLNRDQLLLYPNPSNGEINIVSSKVIDELKVFNVLGQMIYESQPRQLKFQFELKEDGLYFVLVTSDNLTSVDKIIVNK